MTNTLFGSGGCYVLFYSVLYYIVLCCVRLCYFNKYLFDRSYCCLSLHNFIHQQF